MDEKKIIAVELFDEILMKAAGIHMYEARIETVEH
jgi:hypothetical protein